MPASTHQVRRATLDDLPALLALWRAMQFDTVMLERRLTDFQLIESREGELLGAIALESFERQGRIHHEAFNDFSMADHGRDALWGKLLSISKNLGLARLWCAEKAPFWKLNGFLPASAANLAKLPPPWSAHSESWTTLSLRDEEALNAALNTDFVHLRKAEQQQTKAVLRRAGIIKVIGVVVIILLAILLVGFCVYSLQHYSSLRRR